MCCVTLCRVPRWLGDWHGPFLGIYFRETVASHGGVVHLDPWVEGLVGEGRPYWPELSPGDSWERDGVEG